MVQLGAAVTDWMMAATCFAGAWSMVRHGRGFAAVPQWYWCFVWAYLSEGVSCVGGGFMWWQGINQKYTHEYVGLDLVSVLPMVVGMVSEALWLILGSRIFTGDVDKSSFGLWSQMLHAALALITLYVTACFYSGMPGSYLLQPLLVLGPAFPLLLQPCWARVGAGGPGGGGKTTGATAAWRRLAAGTVLNLLGGVMLGGLDNICTGRSCITEFLPWEASPCRWAASDPPGLSCPLPEWFNHAAIMHVLCICGCLASVWGLQGLLACGWKPEPVRASPGGNNGDQATCSSSDDKTADCGQTRRRVSLSVPQLGM